MRTNLSRSMTCCGSIVGFVVETDVTVTCDAADVAVVDVAAFGDSIPKLQSAVNRLSAAT